MFGFLKSFVRDDLTRRDGGLCFACPAPSFVCCAEFRLHALSTPISPRYLRYGCGAFLRASVAVYASTVAMVLPSGAQIRLNVFGDSFQTRGSSGLHL